MLLMRVKFNYNNYCYKYDNNYFLKILFSIKRFNKVFDQDCKQDEVFEEVAQGVIDK